MNSGIYIIKNNINGKVYVGSATCLKRRWKEHNNILSKNKHHSQKLQRAVNKYGIDNFEFIPIQYCEKENLISNEQHWIDLFDSYNKGYNASKFAKYAMKGRKHSEQTKKKMSLSGGKQSIGKTPWNKGIKSGHIPWNKGLKGKLIHNEEIKKKISTASKEMWLKQEKIKCIYCNQEGSIPGIKRWHNENCKNKTNVK